LNEIAPPGQLRRYAANLETPMNMRITLLIPLCLFACSSTAFAQGNDSICTTLETSVRTNAPSWKLVRKSKLCHWFSYFQWTSGKSTIYAIVYPVESRKAAVDTFQLLASDDEVLGEKTNSLGTGLRELGDDNRLWTTLSAKARGVDFRKGNVVVRISGPTMELALRFAGYIAQSLPAA
jgi:hypothetical protein